MGWRCCCSISRSAFLNGLLAAVTLPDALMGVFKGTIYGFIVGVAGCMKVCRPLRCRGG